ncbi:putative transport and Golgi organization protein 6-like isoform X3 [Penaeus vannamei]|uniref:Putative transport and Golgi organization protein 6-like isoform X3 n=1 Tax=Penaeus vannamei TaxID=6689 RepID=A0A423SKX0_PENVA|nr:putative transport and Golgi organization protein 6-like isoform X3 [Penaeus vannamei]
MVDVMVGDLSLVDPPSIIHRSKNPLCPVIAVQIFHGPLLYIPFLSPESVQAHLRDIHDGHNFLPLEIEESYLKGGKFVFRKGRSCLFTAPLNSFAKEGDGIDSRNDTDVVVGSYVNLVILNGLCFPPSVFGRCKAAIPVSGRENREPKRCLTGKVILSDHLGKSVASLQVSITLRSLGEDIALHARHFDTTNGEEKQSVPGVVPSHKFSEDMTIPDYELSSRRLRLDRTINLLQERENSKKTPFSHIHDTVLDQSYVINQHFVDQGIGSSKYGSQSHETSEVIAMKIAEFERNVQDNSKEFLTAPVVSPRIGGKLPQPSPLLFTGRDAEAERLWNSKMKEVGGYVLDFDNDSSESFPTSEGEENILKNEDKTEEIEKLKKIVEKHKDPREIEAKKMNYAKERSQRNLKNTKNADNRKSVKHAQGMKRPTGWLRSTPIAPYRMYSEPPRPKLTRTSLLRRAKLDPELAKQLRAEVDFQVKQKLKILDEAFKEEMSNLRKKKLMRSARQNKMAASSQTEDERAEDDLLLERKPLFGLEDFSQQTDLFHQKSHQFTQMGESFTREMDGGKRVSRAGSPINHATHEFRKGRGGLQRGETYDVDLTERIGSPFSVKEAQKSVQEISIEENLVRSSSSKGGSLSMAVVTESNRRRASSVQSDSKATNSEALEVSEASSLSAEVYQEILRGKKADILLSNGSKSSRVQEAVSISSAAEEVVTADDDSAQDIRQGNEKSNILQQLSKARGKGLINSRTYSIKEGQGLAATYKIPVIHGSSSESDAIIRGRNSDTKFYAQSQSLHSPRAERGPVNVEVKHKDTGNTKLHGLSKGTPSPRVEEEEEEEGTISDISARIAALLLPKKSKVGRKNAAQIPPAPPDLISVQQAKDIEAVCRVLFYTAVLGCLDSEASIYVKMMLVKNKFVLGSDLPSVPQECRHAVLGEIFRNLLPVMKHETLGTCMRGPLFPEVLSSILQLCFGPVDVKNFPEDTAFFRDQMESLFLCMDNNHAIQQILLLKGLAQRGVWFKKVCGLLLVRRFMFQPGGVAAVIGAGLSICNGRDWQQCEAVASLIAQAKISNMDQLYSTAGPQIAELLLQEELKPEILRVVVLTVAQMARRSASLTALHVTYSLLKPLVDTTTAEAARIFASSDANLTLCITRIHKLFVEIATPTVALTSLLQPVLCPLMAVAALMTSHLRSKAQQILVRSGQGAPASASGSLDSGSGRASQERAPAGCSSAASSATTNGPAVASAPTASPTLVSSMSASPLYSSKPTKLTLTSTITYNGGNLSRHWDGESSSAHLSLTSGSGDSREEGVASSSSAGASPHSTHVLNDDRSY